MSPARSHAFCASYLHAFLVPLLPQATPSRSNAPVQSMSPLAPHSYPAWNTSNLRLVLKRYRRRYSTAAICWSCQEPTHQSQRIAIVPALQVLTSCQSLSHSIRRRAMRASIQRRGRWLCRNRGLGRRFCSGRRCRYRTLKSRLATAPIAICADKSHCWADP